MTDDSSSTKVDALSTLKTLEAQLDNAVRNENYAEASKLKSKIDELRRDATLAVLQCNAEFYRAFRDGDIKAMDSIWATSDARGVDMVTCAHPGRETLVGRDAVMQSWKDIIGAGSPSIFPENVKVFLGGGGGGGGGCAWVVCEEHIEGHPACLATNIFVADSDPAAGAPGAAGGGWRIAHHQGGHLVYYGLRVTRNN